ncbi:hypothetical protein I79_016335 [Cricetulus griseus]|uniref:Uncharacterized protein n=1 Tax=Cricetulus griseus TaxID=10029 RepID=G3HZ40_CRIGR|nr:hypothetical protein I79_016335 [Cricetulus griseus]
MHFTLQDSAKAFTSQCIHNRSHLGLEKLCQAIFVTTVINVDLPHDVISQTDVCLFSPLLPPQICGTAYKNVPQ